MVLKNIMQHIRLDRSTKLSNPFCVRQTKTLHFDIFSLLLAEQFSIQLAVTLKTKMFLLIHLQFWANLLRSRLRIHSMLSSMYSYQL